MNARSTRDMAGEFVLGTLEEAEREAFERALETDQELRAEVAFWETTFGASAAAVAELEPSPSLWQSIESGLSAQPPPGTFSVHAGDGAWVTLLPGVEKKLLHADRDEGMQSYLLRLAPGAVVPAHEHPRTEECVVLEGDLRMGLAVLRAGEYHVAPAGIAHPALISDGGALVFLRGSL